MSILRLLAGRRTQSEVQPPSSPSLAPAAMPGALVSGSSRAATIGALGQTTASTPSAAVPTAAALTRATTIGVCDLERASVRGAENCRLITRVGALFHNRTVQAKPNNGPPEAYSIYRSAQEVGAGARQLLVGEAISLTKHGSERGGLYPHRRAAQLARTAS